MKYRIIAPIIFILGLLVIALLMNGPDEVPGMQPSSPTQSAPAQQPAHDPFKNLKIP